MGQGQGQGEEGQGQGECEGEEGEGLVIEMMLCRRAFVDEKHGLMDLFDASSVELVLSQ